MRRIAKFFPKLLVGVALLAATSGMMAGEALATYTSPNYVDATTFSNTLQAYPKLTDGGNAYFSYDNKTNDGANYQLFSIAGQSGSMPQYYTSASGNNSITSGLFTINLKVAPSGQNWVATSLSSTDLSVSGTVLDHVTHQPIYSGTLLTGSLANFAVNDVVGTGDIFEFLFTVTGGTMNSVFGGNNATVGIYFTTNTGTIDDYFLSTKPNTSYNTSQGVGGKLAQATVVPIPPSIFMFLSGFVGLGLLGKFGKVL